MEDGCGWVIFSAFIDSIQCLKLTIYIYRHVARAQYYPPRLDRVDLDGGFCGIPANDVTDNSEGYSLGPHPSHEGCILLVVFQVIDLRLRIVGQEESLDQ